MPRELLLGCGSRREKLLAPAGRAWGELVTLDINEAHKPHHVWDLNVLPLPFNDSYFGEIHAYDVLEHVGAQGDWRVFFAQFSEFWRLLQPGGFFCAIVPSPKSPWAWGDPGHTRVLPPEVLTFLRQPSYAEQVGKTALSDYRFAYRADFEPIHISDDGSAHAFVLEAVKPARIKPLPPPMREEIKGGWGNKIIR